MPQDKVHDFSKMDSKQLLVKTIEAVGDIELRKDHEKLKQIQLKKENIQVETEKKENLLKSLRDTLERLELDVEELRKSKELKEKLRLLQQKQQWCQVRELEIDAAKERQKLDELLKEKQEMEAKIAPQVNKNKVTFIHTVIYFQNFGLMTVFELILLRYDFQAYQ